MFFDKFYRHSQWHSLAILFVVNIFACRYVNLKLSQFRMLTTTYEHTSRLQDMNEKIINQAQQDEEEEK
jgi:hypothetical protein